MFVEMLLNFLYLRYFYVASQIFVFMLISFQPRLFQSKENTVHNTILNLLIRKISRNKFHLLLCNYNIIIIVLCSD